MNCVSLVMLLFVRQMKTIYLLKLDNQAVDKKNTEDSPCANVNCINLCILCYDCLDLPGRPKTGEGGQRTEMTRKQRDSCHDLLIFVKTLFTLNDWFPLGQRALTITEI